MAALLTAEERAALGNLVKGLPQCARLGIDLVSIDPGKVLMKVDWRPELVGNPDTGVIHGGVITTLLDTVAGLVTYTQVPKGSSIATLDIRIDYLKPAMPRQPIFGEGEVYRLTQSVAFIKASAYQDEPDNAIANCLATFMVGSVGFAPDLPIKKGEG